MRKEEVEKIENLSSENWERRKFSIEKLEQKEGTKARSRPWKDVKSWREFAERATNPPRVHIALALLFQSNETFNEFHAFLGRR